MSEEASDLDLLRRRARRALARGELSLADLDLHSQRDLEQVVEDLRIHQAELEIQNRELSESRARIESERTRYRALFEGLPLPALVIDRMGVIEQANQTAVEFFGFRASQSMRRHSVYRLFSDRGGNWFGRVMEAAGEGDGPSLAERIPVIRADGEDVPMDCHALNPGAGYHADRHTLLLFVDRTSERERDRQRALYGALMDNSEALIYAFDLSDRCLLMNPAASRMFGVGEVPVLGKSRAELMGAELARHEAGQDRQALYGHGPVAREERRTLPDGNDAVYMALRFALRDERNEVFAVAVIATDVSAQRSLQSRLDLASEVFSRGSEAILITDAGNRVVFANAAFEHVSGYREAQIIGRNPLAMASDRHDRPFFLKIKKALASDGYWDGEVWPRRANGETYPAWLRISRVRSGPDEDVHHVLVLRDISKEKMAEEEIERLAFFDMLTGTPNRYLLKDRVAQEIRSGIRSDTPFALAFLDLDRFKEVNDAFGHETGDRLLVHFARRLRESLREEDTVCRLGGDEFVLLLKGIDRVDATERLDRVLQEATRPFVIAGRSHQVSASIGVAMFPVDGDSFDELLKNADTAMYQAKSAGRDRCCFFHADMAEAASSNARIEAAMRDKLKNDGFHLVYQPQIDLAAGGIVGLEALLRWDAESAEDAPGPGKFIPLAEQSGLIVPLGNWVLERAAGQIAAWQDSPLGLLPVAVNVAAEQFWRDGFLDAVSDRLARHGIDPSRLFLELTERTAMKMPTEAAELIGSFGARGIRCALDDFGTGYSSLAYLKRFPLDVLKIDRSFVADLADSEDDQAICRAIIQVAHTLGMKVLAEGVETPAQEAFLREAGCDQAQGFLYAPGLSPDELATWMAEYRATTA